MARTTIQVPYDVTFPQACARCTAPATKTLRVQRQKPSASQSWAWFFFGILGWLVAGGASKDATIRYEIPHCDACHRQTRLFQAVLWGLIVLVLVFFCGGFALSMSLTPDSTAANALMVVAMLAFLLGGAAIVVLSLFISSRHPVAIQRVNDKLQSVRLGFLNPSYFELFRQENLERIVALGLHSGKAQLPLEEAVEVVSRQIDTYNPRLPASLKGYFERGQIYLQHQAYAQAISDLSRVIDVTGFENPYFLDAQFFRGQAYLQSGNSMQAQIDLENYLKAASDKARIKQARQWLKQIGRG